MKKGGKKYRGFTLIELMIVITIIVILSGMSIAGYSRFTQRQAAMDDARNFVSEMRKVQSLAKNLVYPDGCGSGLGGYRLLSDCSGQEDCKNMTVDAICGGSEGIVTKSEPILSAAYFTNDVNVLFEAGTGNLSPYGTYLMSDTKDPYQVTVTTDSNGVINMAETEVTPTI